MGINYDRLWKILVDRNINKTKLRMKTNIGTGTLAKLSKSEPVSLEVLAKICMYLQCNIGDIMEFIYE